MEISSVEIKTRIDWIEQVLAGNTHFFDEKGVNLGISNGILGMSLFYYYYYLYTGKEGYLDLLMKYLDKSFKGLNQDYTGSFIVLDMVEATEYLYFLKSEGMIEDDVNEFCIAFDSWVNKFLIERKKVGDLEPYGGMIRAGGYFLLRSDDIDVKEPINAILEFIESRVRTISNDLIFFDYEFIHKNQGGNQLGKGHGMSGIIFFILQVYKKGLYVERCRKLLIPAINFLFTRNNDSGVNLFHYDIEGKINLSYSNLSYGDLGIAYTLFFAGIELQIPEYISKSTSIVNHIAKFRDDEDKFLKDANLRYGASGNFSLFRIFENHIPSEEVKKAKQYWIEKTLSFNNNDTPWAGYNTFFNGDLPEMQLSFDRGICGIGITLMCDALQVPPKYMSFLGYNFI